MACWPTGVLACCRKAAVQDPLLQCASTAIRFKYKRLVIRLDPTGPPCPRPARYISVNMIVTPAQAGGQFESVWIPACAGMTKRHHAKLVRKFFWSISPGHPFLLTFWYFLITIAANHFFFQTVLSVSRLLMEKPLIIVTPDSGGGTVAAQLTSFPSKNRSVKHTKVRVCAYGLTPMGKCPDARSAL